MSSFSLLMQSLISFYLCFFNLLKRKTNHKTAFSHLQLFGCSSFKKIQAIACFLTHFVHLNAVLAFGHSKISSDYI